jgi:rubrerythrin
VIAQDLKPTPEQLADAVSKVKTNDRLTSSTIKHTDHGAGMVRHYLAMNDSRFATYPLDEIRLATQNLSRAGKEPGAKQKTKQERTEAALSRLLRVMENSFPRAADHSAEYNALHESEEYKRYRDELKRLYDYRCQGCSCHFLGKDLQGHIVDYQRWKEPGMLLILCEPCHRLIDTLRRRGAAIARDEWVAELF